MTKEERVKLVFETISKIVGFEIKPDKDFHMFRNGIDGVYQIGDDLNLYYKEYNDTYKISNCTMSQIFKGVYQFEEIKEPLTTEEEKDFLRQFKFDKLEMLETSNDLYLYDKNWQVVVSIDLDTINFKLGNLQEGKKYSREELGL